MRFRVNPIHNTNWKIASPTAAGHENNIPMAKPINVAKPTKITRSTTYSFCSCVTMAKSYFNDSGLTQANSRRTINHQMLLGVVLLFGELIVPGLAHAAGTEPLA